MTTENNGDKVAADYLNTLSKEQLVAMMLKARLLLIEYAGDLDDKIADSICEEQQDLDQLEATERLLYELVNEPYEGPSEM